MFESLQQFVINTDEIWQWLALILLGAIPYVESYTAAVIGVVAGVALPIAILASIVGNVVSMLAFVTFGTRLHRPQDVSKPLFKRREKFKAAFDKYGIAGVSLLGQTLLPSQITSMAMVGLGADKGKVIFWQIISIILWGVAFGLLAYFGINIIQG